MSCFLGKMFLAGGFALGMYGLAEDHTLLQQTSLGLIVIGVVALGYGVYRSLFLSQDES